MVMLVKDLGADISVNQAEFETRRGDDYRRILFAKTKIEQDELMDWWEEKYGLKAEIADQWKKCL